MIRRNGTVRENRTLLEENGRKMREPQTRLRTKRFFSCRFVYGPVGFFGRDRHLEIDRPRLESGEYILRLKAVCADSGREAEIGVPLRIR